ncbi:MAG: divergent polysaccharide deacetylase family protein [Devosia sp.]|nr:divergent polysaccharide deacetylase family protein [Devosia sp.]
MASDLDAPLSRRRAKTAPASGRRHLPIARLASAGIAALLLIVALRVVLVSDPDGGRPSAEVAINSTRHTNAVAGGNATPPGSEALTVGPEIPASGFADPAATSLEELPDSDPVATAMTEPDESGNLADLVEQTEYGAIPRIGGNGHTPFAAYARPSVTPDTASGRPLIAIVVTGLGLNLAGSLEAIEKLPDNVTLAFAPYGRNLARAVGSARAEGHEIFLEVPLEPFDYPENDPGPDTLLTGQAPRDNMRKLFKVMSRFGGYVGLINNMGARFTASGTDFGPMMEELGARGLGYLDDGSSNRSLAPQLAQANRVPFNRADMMLDANPARAPILAALAELEAKARQQGAAIGIISALPISVQTIAEWARGLQEKGIVIVPASALMKS